MTSPTTATSTTANAFKNLKEQLRTLGVYEADPWFAVRQSVQAVLLFTATCALMHFSSILALIAASMMLAMYYCQCAYISHDMAHGQIVRNKKGLDFLFPMLSFAQGLSLTWWKRKHNLHHHSTNVIHNHRPIDGDIDTMPLFCWTDKLLTPAHMESKFYQFWLPIQRYMVWVFFPFMRGQWISFGIWEGTMLEKAVIIAHQITLLALMSWISPLGIWGALALWLGANAIAGFLLASFFLFGHSGMEIVEKENTLDDFTAQIRTTRNFNMHPIITWLSGGLNYQIEHHLFPAVPRSKLPMISPYVQALAKQSGEVYTQDSIRASYKEIFKSLKVI